LGEVRTAPGATAEKVAPITDGWLLTLISRTPVEKVLLVTLALLEKYELVVPAVIAVAATIISRLMKILFILFTSSPTF
jgi:hypothetical protein